MDFIKILFAIIGFIIIVSKIYDRVYGTKGKKDSYELGARKNKMQQYNDSD